MTESAPFLLVDLGNTSAKLRLADPTHLLGETRRMPTPGLSQPGGQGRWHEATAGWQFTRVVLSSVVPAATRTALEVWPDALSIGGGLDTGVDLRGYPGAGTLGADRIANMAGALALHGPGPLIVVDFGTAATFNALDAAGRFLGGVIAPGLAAVRDYLPLHTAQLPAVDLRHPPRRAIGRNTHEAILAGVTLGYRGLVRELLAGLRAELAPSAEETVRVVATGGDASWVAGALPDVFNAVDLDLTLQGLRVIAARLPNSPPQAVVRRRPNATAPAPSPTASSA